ncbi:MAG: diaminopimelate decarboxylase [Gammaproteobacteria bacterium]|jgi:diaminopimelate decarboxylase
MTIVDAFNYVDGCLYAEGVSCEQIAREHGTPTFVYSRAAIESRYLALDRALDGTPHRICYAVKANSNLAVLDVLARLGAGFDIVSSGELQRVIAAGGDASKVVFSGVGKRADEITEALQAGVTCFNIESAEELGVLADCARVAGVRARMALRVNPDVDAQTHPYISTGLKGTKFGVAIEDALALYLRAAAIPCLQVVGVACHIGSQLTDPSPMLDALQRVLALVGELKTHGVNIAHIDMGGGFGIRYQDETPHSPTEFAQRLAHGLGGRELELLLEPGRSIVGEAGVLLTRVIHTKHNSARSFLVADAAMNDLIRPALYQGWHPLRRVHEASDEAAQTWDLVGPVCESADFLALQRTLPAASGDLLALECCGAYSFVMSSNYNSRPRAAEVMVDGGQIHLVRAREQIADLFATEHCLPH